MNETDEKNETGDVSTEEQGAEGEEQEERVPDVQGAQKATQQMFRAISIDESDSEREVEATRKVEAALFVAGRFLSLQELVALTEVNPLMLRKILEDLKDAYKNAGVEIVQKNALWKMDVVQEYAWLVNKLATGSAEFSKAEQETLAMIAYKQPIKQSVVVNIRGNKAYEHVKKFVEIGLVNKRKLGHTAELTLSESFHEYFSLPRDEGLLEHAGREGVSAAQADRMPAARGADSEE